MLRKILLTTAAALVLAGIAPAADIPGVKVYPGAKYDDQWTKMQAEVARVTGGGESACYRTGDAVRTVAEFYQKEGFRASFGEVTDDSARLQQGAFITVTIRRVKTQDRAAGTRICIVKK